jgi:hypothetical protein
MRAHHIVKRLLAHWRQASRAERQAGARWYADARAACEVMARQYGCCVDTACGVVAALSPRIHWVRNLEVARQCLAREAVHGVFRVNLAKAEAIRDGARPLQALSGPKVRAFYRALAGDESGAVIDVWMLRAAGWTRALTEKAYQLVASALAMAAAKARTTVARFQAAVWTHVRGRAT